MAQFGDSSLGADTFPCSADRLLTQRATCPETGTATDVYGYFALTGVGTSAKGVIFSVSGAEAGTLLAESAGVAITGAAGFKQLALLVPLAVSAQDYFIGIVTTDGPRELGQDIGLSGQEWRQINGYDYATTPDTTPAPTQSKTDQRHNIYVEYTAGAAPRKFFLIKP